MNINHTDYAHATSFVLTKSLMELHELILELHNHIVHNEAHLFSLP